MDTKLSNATISILLVFQGNKIIRESSDDTRCQYKEMIYPKISEKGLCGYLDRERNFLKTISWSVPLIYKIQAYSRY